MKHLFKTAYCLLLLAAAGCQKYDDHELWDELDRHARRIADIEAWQDRVENNITALQQLVDALQERRYITGVSEFTTPEPGGYDVGFSSGAPIRIWNGAK
ncbi:MAG: DUF4988 domain-containing protein, partial [Prevotellaceae bacterium]|nr:DUF4988 domain-containing protein [Prevotellaceae bacterium]